MSSTVRGRGRNVEIAVDRALPAAGEELRAHFTERPDFYRGSHAVANFGVLEPGAAEIGAFRDMLAEFGITLDGVSGSDSLAETLANLQLAYLGPAPVAEVSALPRSRPPPPDRALARSALAGRRLRRRARRPGPAPHRQDRSAEPARASGRPASPRPASRSRRPRRTHPPACRRSTTAARCAAVRRCTTWATSS